MAFFVLFGVCRGKGGAGVDHDDETTICIYIYIVECFLGVISQESGSLYLFSSYTPLRLLYWPRRTVVLFLIFRVCVFVIFSFII